MEEKGKKERKKREKKEPYGFANRLLRLYDRLNKGRGISKKEIEAEFHIGKKTVERDIEHLRKYYREKYQIDEEFTIRYDAKDDRYYLDKSVRSGFAMEEVLAIVQILLASRAFCEEEKELLVSKLLDLTYDKERSAVERITANERVNYTPLKHGKKLLEPIDALTEYIGKQQIIEITYKRMDGEVKVHRIKPVAIMFEIFYFYLHAYMANDSKEDTTIFRIDRILKIKPTKDTFRVETGEKRFQEGEVRKRVQFMYSGKSERVKFEYHGRSIEAVQDWLPEAEIEPLKGGGYLVRARIQGEGARMWIRSQGEWVRMVEKGG